MGMTTTGILIIVCVIACTLYETIAFVMGKKEALLSTWLQRIGFRHPLVCLFVGIIIGHVWCYYPPDVTGTKIQCPVCCEMIELRVDEHSGELRAIEVKR